MPYLNYNLFYNGDIIKSLFERHKLSQKVEAVAVPDLNRELSDREVRLFELGRQDTTTPVTVTVTVYTTPEFRSI
jgi:hypothetical protein